MAFSARELILHAREDSALAAALQAAGVSTSLLLGRRLRRWEKAGAVQRLGRDGRGAVRALSDVK